MSKLEVLKGFDTFFVANQEKFKPIFDSNEPQNLPIPGDWDKKLDYF